MDDNVVFITDLDLGLWVPWLGRAKSFVEGVGDGSNQAIGQKPGTDDGTFNGSNRNIQKVMSVRP